MFAYVMTSHFVVCDSRLSAEPLLHRAAYNGDLEEIKRLINAGESVHSLNTEGATSLHWAAFKGQDQAVEVLIQYGADVNAQTDKGSAALHLAMTHEHHTVISMLNRYGALP